MNTISETRKAVLFVDDCDYVLKGIKLMARGVLPEWDAEFARDGQAALEALRRRPFDVLVTDASMPGMEGEQLVEASRAARPALRCLLLTGAPDAHQDLRGIVGIVAKPCDPLALKEALNDALRSSNEQAEYAVNR